MVEGQEALTGQAEAALGLELVVGDVTKICSSTS